TDADLAAAGLKSGERKKSWSVVAELSILLGREQRPIVLHAAVDTAVLVIAHANELTRTTDRKGLEQHGMDKREDGGGGADAQRQRENGGKGEAGSFNELSK